MPYGRLNSIPVDDDMVNQRPFGSTGTLLNTILSIIQSSTRNVEHVISYILALSIIDGECLLTVVGLPVTRWCRLGIVRVWNNNMTMESSGNLLRQSRLSENGCYDTMNVKNSHDGVMILKRFPHHWPFVRDSTGQLCSHQNGRVMRSYYVLLYVSQAGRWTYSRVTGDLRRCEAYVMYIWSYISSNDIGRILSEYLRRSMWEHCTLV